MELGTRTYKELIGYEIFRPLYGSFNISDIVLIDDLEQLAYALCQDKSYILDCVLYKEGKLPNIPDRSVNYVIYIQPNGQRVELDNKLHFTVLQTFEFITSHPLYKEYSEKYIDEENKLIEEQNKLKRNLVLVDKLNMYNNYLKYKKMFDDGVFNEVLNLPVTEENTNS